MSKFSFVATLFFSFEFIISCKNNRQEEFPNILLIVADDMGQDMRCYGDTIANTPNLDRLANENVLFENAYVTTASCSPSRSSILTGLYPHQNGQIGLSHHGFNMHKAYQNIASVAKEKDYTTGLLGKLHVKPFNSFPFDYTVSIDFPLDTHLKGGYNHDSVTVIEIDGTKHKAKVKYAQTIKRVADSADVFFSRLDNDPFFLMVNFLDPHHPFYDQIEGFPQEIISASEVVHSRYSFSSDKKNTAGYYNGISRIDIGYGMLEQLLKEKGLFENTLIIFLGDHGAPFEGAKMTCYELGLRVPMIVKFPFQQYTGRYASEVSSLDIFPTILKYLSFAPEEELPGYPMQDIIEGKTTRDLVYGEFNFHGSAYINPVRSLKKGNYKIIVNYLSRYYNSLDYTTVKDESNASMAKEFGNKPTYELYDLAEDPYEEDNLAQDTSRHELLTRMIQELETYQKKVNDTLISPEGMAYFKDMINQQVLNE